MKNGGAINALSSAMSIKNCRFDTCVAQSGGAIKAYKSDLSLDGVDP
jgi:hypothetical protein